MSVSKAAESAVEAEKGAVVTHDDGLPPDVAALMQEFSGARGRKLMRKLDMRLIPIVSSFYSALSLV